MTAVGVLPESPVPAGLTCSVPAELLYVKARTLAMFTVRNVAAVVAGTKARFAGEQMSDEPVVPEIVAILLSEKVMFASVSRIRVKSDRAWCPKS